MALSLISQRTGYGSRREVARILGRDFTEIPDLVARGLIRSIQIPGHRAKYSIADAEALLASSTMGKAAPGRDGAASTTSPVPQPA